MYRYAKFCNIVTGNTAPSASAGTTPYLNYTKGDFEGLCPVGATRCTGGLVRWKVKFDTDECITYARQISPQLQHIRCVIFAKFSWFVGSFPIDLWRIRSNGSGVMGVKLDAFPRIFSAP